MYTKTKQKKVNTFLVKTFQDQILQDYESHPPVEKFYFNFMKIGLENKATCQCYYKLYANLISITKITNQVKFYKPD